MCISILPRQYHIPHLISSVWRREQSKPCPDFWVTVYIGRYAAAATRHLTLTSAVMADSVPSSTVTLKTAEHVDAVSLTARVGDSALVDVCQRQ